MRENREKRRTNTTRNSLEDNSKTKRRLTDPSVLLFSLSFSSPSSVIICNLYSIIVSSVLHLEYSSTVVRPHQRSVLVFYPGTVLFFETRGRRHDYVISVTQHICQSSTTEDRSLLGVRIVWNRGHSWRRHGQWCIPEFSLRSAFELKLSVRC